MQLFQFRLFPHPLNAKLSHKENELLYYYLPLIPPPPPTDTHTYTHEYETGSSWHVQINWKAWQKKCVFRLTSKVGREGGREKLSGRPAASSRQSEQCNQKNIHRRFSGLFLEFWAVFLSKIEGSMMVDICREKKTGMAEECRQSDGMRALRACTECSILLGASGVLSKAVWHDHTSIFSR